MNALFLTEWQANLRYLDFSGKEPALVYLAGLGLAASGSYARAVAEAGLTEHRAILVDWLGSGFSDRPQQFSYSLDDHAATAAALLDHVGLKACVVVGHSMGGAIAIVLATARPDLVAQLVLAEANLDAGGGFMSKRIAEQTEADFVDHGYQKILAMMQKQSNSGDASANIALGMLQVAAPHALHRSAVSLVQGTEPVMRDQLLNLSIPRSFIFGDQSLPNDNYEQLPSHGIKVAVVSDAGHGMMWDNPAGFAQVVASLLIE